MNDNFKEQINKYSLRFYDLNQEKNFNRYLIEKSLLWFKFALISGVIFFIGTSIVDFKLYSESAMDMLMARIFLMLPVVLIVFFNRQSEWYIENAMKLNIIAIILAGFGVLVVTYIGRHETLIYINYVGVIISFIYLYTFLRVNFVYCAIIGNALLIASIATQILVVSSAFEVVISNIFYLIIANFICLFTCYLLEYQYRKEFVLKEKLEAMSIEDSLTGLYNRHFYQIVVEKELTELLLSFDLEERKKRDAIMEMSNYCGILLIDIDHFKKVNDQYGHAVGDQILVQFADVLKSEVRSNDYIIRWGGEEFLIAIPNADSNYIESFAQKLGETVYHYKFNSDMGQIKITCSIGAINISECCEYDLTKIIALADEKLYKAKNSGRNQGWILNCINGNLSEDNFSFE